MLIEASTTVTQKVTKEIPLPYFCRNGEQFYKVINEEECVLVDTHNEFTRLRIGWMDAEVIVNAVPISEEAFTEAFYQSIAKFKKYIPLDYEI